MKKVLLIILDGFGIRKNDDFNAIAAARKPNLTNYLQNYAFGEIYASEQHVGLPSGQFGNSEVGHLNLGAGRIVRQDITKIDHAIATGEFYTNQVLNDACWACSSGNLHILGLLSDGGVHAHQKHIYELIKLAATIPAVKQIYVHAFLDGRDTPPQSAKLYIQQLEDVLQDYPQAAIATICGRYYAMDRDNRWERIKLAYAAISQAQGAHQYSSPLAAIEGAYAEQINDEFIQPAIFKAYPGIASGDAVIFANYRSDRALQLSTALVSHDFKHFTQADFNLAAFVTMTRYSDQLACPVAFPPAKISNTLGEYISSLGLKQLRIAETEKYPHITYFFNGGESTPFKNETRILINSPQEVATYDLKPEMSLPEVASQLVSAIQSDEYDLIISNFANGDMVGHTGNYAASIQAVEALDKYVGIVVEAMLARGGEVLLVADHGNCEEMFDYKAQQPHTQHTTNLVPCIYIGRKATITSGGALQDVAPTLLAMLGVAKPDEMTGNSLINLEN